MDFAQIFETLVGIVRRTAMSSFRVATSCVKRMNEKRLLVRQYNSWITTKRKLLKSNIKIDDYRITCCISLLKYFLIKYRNESEEDYLDVHITSAEELTKLQKNREHGIEEEVEDNEGETAENKSPTHTNPSNKINDQTTTASNTQQTATKPTSTSSAQASNCKINIYYNKYND